MAGCIDLEGCQYVASMSMVVSSGVRVGEAATRGVALGDAFRHEPHHYLQYRSASSALYDGRAQVVEGCVDHFTPGPADRRGYESFA